MIIVGTAGHIDHGKSAIVKRLTGTDPDRLPEEQARGMTIDLGFAFYQTSQGETIGLVDVPGHERFVKNMIAGAGGIDAVMLVIAADDGWMPQTEEHFQITRLLGTRAGLIVINKTDLAEPDWLQLLETEVRENVRGSFLHDAPIVKVSAVTGDGFDVLRTELDRLAATLASRRDTGTARLWIDRSFIRQGIGGVVTGTLRGSTLSVGQTVAVWPSRKSGKVRTLQSSNSDVQTAVPGQRTAVSITGVDREHLVRGGIVSARTDLDFYIHHPVLALSLEMLPNAPVELRNRRRALMVVGTTEMEGEVRLYHERELQAGQSGIVFFQPDQPIYCLVRDRYILRLPTPMVTLGGGAVIDHLEDIPRQKQLGRYDYLSERTTDRVEALVVSEIRKQVVAQRSSLLLNADIDRAAIEHAVGEALKSGAVVAFVDWLVHIACAGEVAEDLAREFDGWLRDNTHERGVPVDVALRLAEKATPNAAPLLEYLVSVQRLVLEGDRYNLPGRTAELKGVIKQAYDELIGALRAAPFEPPRLSDLAAKGKVHQKAIKYLVESGEVYKCGAEFLFLTETWRDLTAFIRARVDETGELRVTDLRDRFGLTRKFGIPVLEETDRLGLTERRGDLRVKGPKYE